MKSEEIIDLEKLQEMVQQRYVGVQKHPTADLWIYNYTQRAQFDRVWTPETLMARGLILDGKSNIVARPFRKFFNLEEATELPPPEMPFKVYEKLDGSLGILYWIEDVPYIATRGSFASEQALVATRMLHEWETNLTVYQRTFSDFFDRNLTYLFEIIYPENRIVVDYGGEEKLVFLAAIDTATGNDVEIDWPFERAKLHDGVRDIQKIRDAATENAEGFVIVWENGLRLKAKFEEYVRLHRIVTGTNARNIWDALKEGQNIDEILERVPDEFYSWVKKIQRELMDRYDNILHAAEEAIFANGYRKMSMKAAAIHITQNCLDLQHVIFAILRDKDVSKVIWKMLRPEATKPFKEEI